MTALERLEKGKDDREFFSIGFKFAHDFISSGKENVEIANESLKRITEALNERVERANYIYKKEVRDYILLDLRRITVEFLRKAVNI